MDNDHEIVPSRDNKVQLFLRDNLLSIRQDEQQVYNIEKEFGKTRKNRDYFVVGIIAVVVIVIGLGSWLVTSRINESSRNVPVDIAVFEDINLKNVLNLAKKAEDTLETVTQERVNAQADYAAALSSLAVQEKSELEILAVKRMPSADRARQKQAITAAYDGRESKLKASYDLKLAEIDARLAEARKQVESFDTKRVEEARAQKQLLDNQQDLYELEKRQMKESYESELAALREKNSLIERENSRLKTDQVTTIIEEYQGKIAALDPVFGDETASGFIARSEQYADTGIPFRSAPEKIPSGLNFGVSDFAEVAIGYEGLDHLLSRIAEVPYENDVARYAASARKMAFLTGAAGESMLKASFARIEAERKSHADAIAAADAKLAASRKETADARQELEQSKLLAEETAKALANSAQTMAAYDKSLSDAVTANGFDGLVFELTDPAAPRLFFLPGAVDTVLSSETPKVYVYRGAKTLIATLLLTKTETGYTVSVEKLERRKELLPLDFVSLDKK